MAKTIESFGIPAVHVCSIVPISQAVGANRILPAIAIPYPLGDPSLSPEEEFKVRKKLCMKALQTLTAEIDGQTVFD